jgi:hypothetical protein
LLGIIKVKNNNKSYVCTICSQDFTRKRSGRRHNTNLHSGTATIVRSIDYIIGRLSGHYSPSDPLLYRNKKKKHTNISSSNNYDNGSGFKVIADNTHDTGFFCRNPTDELIDHNNNYVDKQFLHRTHVFGLKSQHPMQNRAGDTSSSRYSDEYKQARSKLFELEQLLTPFCSPQIIYNTLNIIVRHCNIRGDYITIDEALENHRDHISKPGWHTYAK